MVLVAALLDEEGQLRLRTPLNIFIGGQILDRGITIANLIGFYYGRDPQKFQQDTVLQHSRMYGFRPLVDCAVTRFYTAIHIHRAMERMHEADSALRERIESQGDDQIVTFIELDDRGTIIPCSPAKILASNITTIRKHRRILPIGFQTDYKTRLQDITEAIDARLRELGSFPEEGDAPPQKITIEDGANLIDMSDPSFAEFESGYEDTWNKDEYKAILRHLSDSARVPENRGKMFLLVRTDLNLSRKMTADAFSDSPDTAKHEGVVAKNIAQDIPVLMMIRQNGAEAQDWRGCPFWWPVIMTSANTRTTLFAHSR